MPINEKLAEKLTNLIAELGNLVEELKGGSAEEDAPQDETNPDNVPADDSANNENEGGNAPAEDTPAEASETPAEEAQPPVDEVPPEAATDGSIEAALSELAAQEQEGAVPPSADVPVTPTEEAPAPLPDPQIGQLTQDLAEANKTIQALLARVDSLEEALKNAGVITSNSAVGDETPRITPNANAESEDAFDDVLAQINGK